MSRGRFIVLEGIDGAGTTTLSEKLQEWLASKGIKAVITREPSDGPVGVLIRNALRGRIQLPEAAGGGHLPQETIALLFAADRIDHLASEIQPALMQGTWVISDRYVDSSVAYQGTLIDIDWVDVINRYAVTPDLTLFLDVDVDTALGRIGATRVQRDIFETSELLVRVAEGYRQHYQKPRPDMAVLDSNPAVDDVFKQMIAAATKALAELQ